MRLPKHRKPLKHSYYVTITERGVDCAFFDYEPVWFDSLNAIWLDLAQKLASMSLDRDCATLRFWRKDDEKPVFEVENPTVERVYDAYQQLFEEAKDGQVE